MKKQRIVILALLVAALLLCSTIVISMAAGSESRATTKYFEVYTADPANGASPVYTETSSNELVTKLQEYLNKGSTWIVLYADVNLSLPSRYSFTNSLHIDLGGHKLTMTSTATDNALCPVGTSAQEIVFENGTLTTKGAKVLYPVLKPEAEPQILFDGMTLDVTNDFSDYRVGGSLTFNKCKINFLTNSTSSCNRFMYLGQADGIGEIEINVIDTEFTAASTFKWSSGDGSIFNFGNKYANTTNLTITGSTFNLANSQSSRLLCNGTTGIANVLIEDTVVDFKAAFIYNANSGVTDIEIGEGVAFNKSCLDNMVKNGTLNITYPSEDCVLLNVGNGLVEYVDPAKLVTVSYYHGDEYLGDAVVKIGAAPHIDTSLDFSGGLIYTDGVLYATAVGFFSDPELKNPVTAITAETDKIYLGAGAGEPCVWAAYSSATPSVETLVTYSTSGAEIIGAVEDTSVKLIECYADATLTHTAAPYSLTRDLTIDAKGNTLTLASTVSDNTFNPQTGVTFVMKNATVKTNGARLLYPGAKPTNVTTNIVFENLKIDWNATVMMDYRAGGTFVARGCEFSFEGSIYYPIYVLHNRSNLSLDMLFEDCVINTGSNSSNSFVTLAAAASNCTVNIEFNGCTFNASNGPALINNQSTTSTFTAKINGDDTNPTYINSKVGVLTAAVGSNTTFTVGSNVYLPAPLESGYVNNVTPVYANGTATVHSSVAGYPYVITDDYVTVTFNNDGVSTTENYVKDYVGSLDSSRTFTVLEIDGVKKVAEYGTVWRDADGNTVSEFIPTDGMVLTGTNAPTGKYASWAIFSAGESSLVAHSLADGYGDALPTNTFSLLPADGVLRLYDDVTLTLNASGVQGVTPANGSTIDLGGHTLTMTNVRFMNAAAENYGFTVVNGTLDVSMTGNNILFSNIGAKGYSVFEGVTFVTAKGMLPFDIRGGGISLVGCTYDGMANGSASFMALSSRYTVGAPIYVVVDNCDIRCLNAFYVNGSASGNPAPPYTPDIDLIVSNTDIDCAYLFSLEGQITSDSVIDVVLEGVRVKSSANNLIHLGVDTTFNLTIEDGCLFNIDPTKFSGGFTPDDIILPDGMSVIEKGEGDYLYSVGVPVYLRWNLTLYTDFNINFFLAKEGINSVKINGEEYPLADMTTVGDDYIFSLTALGASRVAESFDIEIGYGDGYTVTYTRSVVDYATDILSSGHSDKTKRLIAAAMQYVYAAYNYALAEGVENPTVPVALSDLMTSELYLAYAPAGDVNLGEGVDMGDIASAFASAQLELAARIRVRFNLNPAYTGTVTIGGESFAVENGINKSLGVNYIVVECDAFSLYDAVIRVEGVDKDGVTLVGAYSLATYINAVKDGVSTDAKALLDGIAAYAAAAHEYKAEIDILDNFIYEKKGNTYTVVGIKNPMSVIVIPEKYEGLYVTEIAAYAFDGHTEITSVTVPGTVKVIGVGAFGNCTALTEINLAEGLETIAAKAFENTAVKSIVIPDSVQAIGMGALLGCNSVESITVPFVGAYRSDSNNYFGYIFGAPSYVANIEYVPASLKTVILSDNATRVPAYSFYGCENIENVVIGSGVERIGISAFFGCKKLTSIYIPATVTSIPAAGYTYNSPFYGCSPDLVIVTESADVSAFGKYWCQLDETKKAEVVSGKSYDEYLAEYK